MTKRWQSDLRFSERRLLADHFLLFEQMPVEHVFHDGRITAHRTTPEARRSDGHVVYDGGRTAPLPFSGLGHGDDRPHVPRTS